MNAQKDLPGDYLLLVEDSENDVFLMHRAMQKAGVQLPMQIVMDGEEAKEYLEGNGKFSDRSAYPMPSLVFLDLKLPYVHGFEILAWMREHSSLKHIPVVVLSSSPEDRDRKQAEALGAVGYMVKPPTREAILETLEMVTTLGGLPAATNPATAGASLRS